MLNVLTVSGPTILEKKTYVQKLLRDQHRMSTCIESRMIPINLLIQEGVPKMINKEAREDSIGKWERRWREVTQVEAAPESEAMYLCRHGDIDGPIPRFLTGHGRFGSYLFKVKRRENPWCQCCDERGDPPEHAWDKCPLWEDQRAQLQRTLGRKIPYWNLAEEMLRHRGRIKRLEEMSGLQRLVNVKDYESHARTILPKFALDYYASGAGDEISLNLNRSSFAKIRPRFLKDVSRRDLSRVVQGIKVTMPLGISPTAMQKMANPEGEVANARAAGRAGTIFILSTISTCSIEEVAEGAPNTNKWFQLYIYKDRSVTLNLVKRAEKNEFKALVLTVDAPIFGIRHADARNKFKLPPHLKMANFDGVKASRINKAERGSGLNEYVNELFDQSLTWEDVKWLRSVTRLPLILKGILTPEDALLAVEAGVSAVFVSNHGARQVDLVPSAVEALPEIVKAVDGRCDVYLDGGITKGTDIFIALALGAKMVFMGRPALWGLACDGENGVYSVLELLRNELDNTMCVTGCSTLEDIKSEMIVPASYYSKF